MNETRNSSRTGRKASSQILSRLGVLGLLILTLALTGCVSFSSSRPKAGVSSLQLTNAQSFPVSIDVLQSQIMRFADSYAATVAQACDDISTKATNAPLRLSVLRWKLGQATSAFTDATGENPVVNALDILVLTTMARMVIQDYGVQTYGDAIRPLLETQCRMETSAWALAGGVLKPPQVKELKDLIDEWRAKNPNQRYIGPIRFREFVAALGRTPTKASSGKTSLFSLLYLDPLAGLDPTAAAIEETRDLGERAMYYSQRMPMLLSWQVEVLAYQLAGQPESQQVLNDANRVANSAEAFAMTVQQLPQVINDQRQAAIQQILDGLTEQGNKSRELLTDTRSALDSAGAAATNINAAIQSLTAFVQFVTPTNKNPTSATNSHPFNVLDYGTAAAQVGAAANNLNALLATINQTAPQIEQLGRQTKAHADAVVFQAFLYGVVLVLILLVGAVLAGLIYRKMANKPAAGGHQSSES
jgi:hypothetical protein